MINAGGILVYTIHNNRVLFLLGDEPTGYSGFSGHIEKGETVIDGVYREFYEESMNIIRLDKKEMNNMPYIIKNNHILFLMKVEYEEYKDIPFYFNRSVDYIKGFISLHCIPTGYMEKTRVDWFSYEDIVYHRRKMRKVFYDTVPDIISTIYSIHPHLS
jgi:hypothetical protein